MKRLISILLFFGCLHISAQHIYRSQIFASTVKTLQIGVLNQNMILPIVTLNGSEVLQIQFDEMSHEAHSYNYKVLHCNADWTMSNLNTNEFLSGFTTGSIIDYELSLNTTFLYTHYKFNLPNEEMMFKISGNYVVVIYEDNNAEKPIAYACFSVVEPKVSITATVRGNTDTELNGVHQQIDFDVALNGYSVRDHSSEIKVFVRQNNRIDNEVSNLKPTFISGSKLSYVNNKSLIFEGGNEYHRFDFSSVYAAGEGVESIKYNQRYYDVYLYDNKVEQSKSYSQNMDVNGKYIINLQGSDNDNTEADYMYVYFRLPAKQPYFDGLLYLGGEFNYNILNANSKLDYDFNQGFYYKKMLLKQGGYNYQYWFVPKGEKKASAQRVDGSYWQTRNEYTIYVYHRPWGERYDKLIGVKDFE